MKKIAAASILAILLFNAFGYRLVANWLQLRAEERMEATIDDGNYNPNQFIELSVVTNLPYTNDWLQWERCSGTIEVNGFHYQYVERKLEKGQMHYRCLPNSEKQTIVSARDEFFQLVNSFNQASQDKPASKSVAINNYIGDYDDAVQYYNPQAPEALATVTLSPVINASLANAEILTPEQPPEFI